MWLRPTNRGGGVQMPKSQISDVRPQMLDASKSDL
jgi:hypothetical protein